MQIGNIILGVLSVLSGIYLMSVGQNSNDTVYGFIGIIVGASFIVCFGDIDLSVITIDKRND